MNHCPHCGSLISERDKWCGFCGGKIDAAYAPADAGDPYAIEDEPTISVRRVPSSGLAGDAGDALDAAVVRAPGKTGDMREHASGFRLMGSMGSVSFGGVSRPAAVPDPAPAAHDSPAAPPPAAEKAVHEPPAAAAPAPEAPGPVRIGRLFGSMGAHRYGGEGSPAAPGSAVPVAAVPASAPAAPVPAVPASAPASDEDSGKGTKLCPDCGEIIFARYTECPSCGRSFGGSHRT